MARLVVHTGKRPYRHVTEKGDEVWICMCGLSETYPLCSGKHRVVARESDNEHLMYDQRGEPIGQATGIQPEVLVKLRRV
ncbi:MAG: CDGSH iron-sulfur domain-containing protein [Thaumarchaeota archaeon]|nr:CDGSH iron-sulfur domain-containing protein [Candidatus Calditenuaceae archaeon]MDW8041883.1 CDGSH iron-sulfur domain-containing protein [Nitrososphaerota archaeon]